MSRPMRQSAQLCLRAPFAETRRKQVIEARTASDKISAAPVEPTGQCVDGEQSP
jgi:hypothetical protein